MYHLLKINKEFKKFKERGDSRYTYRNDLDKTCFQDDIPFGDFKDLVRRTASYKILHDNAKNPNYDEYLIKTTSGGTIRDENMSNKEISEKLHQPIIRKFKKTKSIFII